VFGLRHYSQNQMQHRAIETAIGKGQALRVALYRYKIGRANPRQGPAEHGAVKVEADIVVLGWQVGQIKPGADASK
jgi:hypothetical protein